MLDGDTRYWITSQVADTKYTEDVRPLFRKSQEVAGKKPKVLLSDGARNFSQAHKKEWYSRYKKIQYNTYAIFISKMTETQTKWSA